MALAGMLGDRMTVALECLDWDTGQALAGESLDKDLDNVGPEEAKICLPLVVVGSEEHKETHAARTVDEGSHALAKVVEHSLAEDIEQHPVASVDTVALLVGQKRSPCAADQRNLQAVEWENLFESSSQEAVVRSPAISEKRLRVQESKVEPD